MLRRELAYFFGALRFFTRLPVPAWVGHSSEALDRSTRYFPAVGLLVGAIAALVFVLTSFVLPMTLAVLAAMASSLYLTGAFHEDGWSELRRPCCAASTMYVTRGKRSRWPPASAGASSVLPDSPPCCHYCCCHR